MTTSSDITFQIPSDEGIEFYEAECGNLEALQGRTFLKFHELPAYAYTALRKAMNKKMANLDEMKQFAFKRYRGIDRDADIKPDGTLGAPDYCEGENFDLGNGYWLTACELRVLKLAELPDKLIADKLFISVTTVLSHWQNMRAKTGLNNKVELAVMATKKGIIQ